jgi:SHS2 domain-containing protein
MDRGYREIPHTADLALEVWGRDLAELFLHAARGLSGLAATIDPAASITACREVSLSAPDLETLLVDWLNELLSLADEHDEAYVDFAVELPAPGQFHASACATRDFRPRLGVKAATFHDLAIRRDERGYRTVVVFDV